MPKTHVSRSKIINAAPEKVFPAIAQMDQWEVWSPWLMMEPEATVTVADDKRSYRWEGQRVGEGHMAITDSVENQSARYDLTFLKPFKSTAKVGMDLREVDGGTEVTWTMDSQLPFFLFFMKRMMEGFIGMDYERGLNLLKDYVEDGKIHSKLNFKGEWDYDGCTYLGIRRACSLEAMPQLMKEDFERLGPWAAEHGLRPESMFCIYHDFNPVKGRCEYTAAVPYVDKPENLPDDFITGSQAASRMYTLGHVGPYEHLGNAWSTLHNMIRSKELKVQKGYHPFETYGNSPQDTDPKDLITMVTFALKS
ncbi:MAG: SRPBCC family protein [Pseudomonadota bacterium]